MKKITIGDIAKALQISKSSVSFILNGKARQMNISENLETRVLAYVKQIGYYPNQGAQSLRHGKTKLIAMMVEDIADPFFSSIARMMEEKAYESGYKILYCSTENSIEKVRELIQLYRTRQVEGYIIAPPEGVAMEISDLIDDGFPVVMFDRTLKDLIIDNVLVDNFRACYNGIQHLIKNGFRKIAMFTLESGQVQMVERQRGYMSAIDEIGAPHLIKK